PANVTSAKAASPSTRTIGIAPRRIALLAPKASPNPLPPGAERAVSWLGSMYGYERALWGEESGCPTAIAARRRKLHAPRAAEMMVGERGFEPPAPSSRS